MVNLLVNLLISSLHYMNLDLVYLLNHLLIIFMIYKWIYNLKLHHPMKIINLLMYILKIKNLIMGIMS